MALATDLSAKSRRESAVCIHCGTAFRPTAQRPDFCCAGCQFVHDLIAKNGLGQFYDLQNGGVFPVKSLVFQQRDYSWLEKLAAESQGALALDLQGLSCVGCVWLIEKLFERRAGALAIHIDSTLGRMNIRFGSGFDVVAFAREVQGYGYLVGPLTGEPKRANQSLIIRLGICGALAMNAMLFTLPTYLGMEPSFELFGLFRTTAFACGTLSFLVGGSYFIARSIQSLGARVLHIDLPISLGLIAAYAGSIFAWRAGADGFVYFDFVSTFTFLMLVGRWVQQVAVDRNRNRLLGLQMTVLEPRAGERFAIASGQVVPVRAKLLSSAATLGLEWINGESEAREAALGQLVPSGAVNLSREVIDLEAMEDWRDSILSRLIEIKPRTDTRHLGLESFIRSYIIVVMSIAVVAFGGWLFATHDVLRALQVLTSILVVSCPCAAGVALPLADELAVAALRRAGVFVRESSLWTRLARVRQIVFDKTGTLTMETMALKNPESLEALGDAAKQTLLAMVRDNLHPVSCALRELLMSGGVSAAAVAEPSEVTGMGLELTTPEGAWRLGRPEWAAPLRLSGDATKRGEPPLASTSDVSASPRSEADCVFAHDGVVLAEFRFGEETRSDAPEELAMLRERGMALAILSGDRAEKVRAMALRVGISPAHAHGEFSPDDKADWLRARGAAKTLMIGDGANDSLAFNEALCTGTPAIDRGLLEHKADFYFLGRGLRGVRLLFEIAAARRTATLGVLGFAIAYNAFAVALSIAGKMSPLAAAVLMPASSLVTLAIVATVLRKRRD